MIRAPMEYDASEAASAPPSVSLEEVVPTPAADAPAPALAAPRPIEGMRTARVLTLRGRSATIALRGRSETLDATVAPEVDPDVIADALDGGEAVLVELCPGQTPLVVAALHTQRVRELKLRASTVTIEGDQEVVIRSGHAALRVRADGDVELVGSRISAASRGLFRLVGRMLRLN
jgi:hypothetical protein